MVHGLSSMENSKCLLPIATRLVTGSYVCRYCGDLHNETKFTFEISAQGFVKYIEEHPAVLTPVYDAVHFLRDHIMSLEYWKRVCSQRMQLYDGRYIPSTEIIKFGGDVAVILKEQKIHRVDHLVRAGDEDWDNR
jgi:hypothetical protein